MKPYMQRFAARCLPPAMRTKARSHRSAFQGFGIVGAAHQTAAS